MLRKVPAWSFTPSDIVIYMVVYMLFEFCDEFDQLKK